ncbi:hypothetical protein BWI17_07235 [Betaproteobacteria bacterium GR16-43]|nr:hypothetical protein BWI17_07235 [Betaproteobacteria bacterium GR16-43]
MWHAGSTARTSSGSPSREHVAPCAEMHVAFRLRGPAVRLIDAGREDAMGFAVAGGMRAGYYVKEVVPGTITVGAQFRHGAARALLGVPADELAGRHVRLGDLWGDAVVNAVLSELQAARQEEERLRILETFLLARVRPVRGMHPAVAGALAGFDPDAAIGSLVERSGVSHRTFISLFRHEVGLPPKLYARVSRFQRMLKQLEADPAIEWATLAMDAGYSDQAHFTREFHEFAGVTPEAYRRIAPGAAHHIPVNSVQDPRRIRR